MEWQGDDVGPGDLADGDGIRDWEGRVDYTLCAGEHFVHGGQVRHYHALVHAVGERPVTDDAFHVRGQVVQHFERQVPKLLPVLVRALDVFPRIRLEEFEPKIGAHGFQQGRRGFVQVLYVGCGAREGRQVAHERGEVFVVGVRFEAQPALERHGEGVDQVQRRQFGEQIRLPFFGVLLVPLLGVDPDMAGQIPRRLDQLGPVLAALDVALVRAGGAEGDAEADDEAEHREQQVGDDELVPELRDAGDDGGPDGDEEQRHNHPRRDAAPHAQEVGHPPVRFDVEGFGDEVVDGARVAAGEGPGTRGGGVGGLAEGGGLRGAGVGVRVYGYGGVFGSRVCGEGGGGGARVEGGCRGHFGGGSALGELKDGVGEVSVHIFKARDPQR